MCTIWQHRVCAASKCQHKEWKPSMEDAELQKNACKPLKGGSCLYFSPWSLSCLLYRCIGPKTSLRSPKPPTFHLQTVNTQLDLFSKILLDRNVLLLKCMKQISFASVFVNSRGVICGFRMSCRVFATTLALFKRLGSFKRLFLHLTLTVVCVWRWWVGV